MFLLCIILLLQEDVRPEVQTILAERLKALNNMGAAQMRIEAYDVALKSLEAVLRCQPDNVKALFRKGKVGTKLIFFFMACGICMKNVKKKVYEICRKC